MTKKSLVAAAIAGLALTTGMAVPANAATSGAAPAPAVAGPAVTPNGSQWDAITDTFCGKINGSPAVGMQTAQYRVNSAVYTMTQTHLLQAYSNGRWVTIAKQAYVAKYPRAAWYYAPSSTTFHYWNVTKGLYREKAQFVWKTPTTIYKDSRTSPKCLVY